MSWYRLLICTWVLEIEVADDDKAISGDVEDEANSGDGILDEVLGAT